MEKLRSPIAIIASILLIISIFFTIIFGIYEFNKDIAVSKDAIYLNAYSSYEIQLDYYVEDVEIEDNGVIIEDDEIIAKNKVDLCNSFAVCKSKIIVDTLKEGNTILTVKKKNILNNKYKYISYPIYVTINPFEIERFTARNIETNETVSYSVTKIDINQNAIAFNPYSPIRLNLGEKYKVSNTDSPMPTSSSILGNEIIFKSYDYQGNPNEAVELTDDGYIIAKSLENGYFDYYSTIYGGFRVKFEVYFDNREFKKAVANSYKILTGESMDLENLVFEKTKLISTLYINTIPKYLSDDLLQSIIPNVDTLYIENIKISNNCNTLCYIPSQIKNVYILSENKYEDIVSFYGSGDKNFVFCGDITLTSYDYSMFYGFNNLTIKTLESKADLINNYYLGEVSQNVVTLKGKQGEVTHTSSTNGGNVVSNVKKLNIENKSSLVIIGGNGADGVTSNINGAKGGSAIITERVEISNYSKLAIVGGTGGNGFIGTTPKVTTFNQVGLTGGQGGTGGTGGCGIEAAVLYIYGNFTNEQTFVYGGNGGKGGQGGTGGQGGRGTDGELWGDSAQNGAKGGTGGNGGAGGNGNYSIKLSNYLENYSTQLICYQGKGGTGGEKGIGGLGGQGGYTIFNKQKENGPQGDLGKYVGKSGISYNVSYETFTLKVGEIIER